MKPIVYRTLAYAELHNKLIDFENRFGETLPELENLLYQSRNMMTRMYQTIEKQAAYHDRGASKHLEKTGSYTQFDEPASVATARELLQNL